MSDACVCAAFVYWKAMQICYDVLLEQVMEEIPDQEYVEFYQKLAVLASASCIWCTQFLSVSVFRSELILTKHRFICNLTQLISVY